MTLAECILAFIFFACLVFMYLQDKAYWALQSKFLKQAAYISRLRTILDMHGIDPSGIYDDREVNHD